MAPPITRQTETGKEKWKKVKQKWMEIKYLGTVLLQSLRATWAASPNQLQPWEDIQCLRQVRHWPRMSSHRPPESNVFLTVHVSRRSHPSSRAGPRHHRSAAAHARLSPQAGWSQAKESPAPQHRGVGLPHQRHVPVAGPRWQAKTASAWSPEPHGAPFWGFAFPVA